MVVEGGFLDGLDLEFSGGLNVLIGGRGTGKTSVIELIRFCLNTMNYSESAARRSREHALGVLGDGRVSLTLGENGHDVHVSRTAQDRAPHATPLYFRPMIFSQNEVESIGLSPSARLRLIDSFDSRRTSEPCADKQLIANVASMTAEMRDLSKEIETLDSDL